MEVVCAFLVLGCAFLLSFLGGDSAVSQAQKLNKLIPPNGAAGGHAGPPRLRTGMQADRERKEQLLKTVEQEPDVVAETLKQWIKE